RRDAFARLVDTTGDRLPELLRELAMHRDVALAGQRQDLCRACAHAGPGVSATRHYAPGRMIRIVSISGSTRTMSPVRIHSSAFGSQPSVIVMCANAAPCTITGFVRPNTSARGAKPFARMSRKAHPAATPPLAVGVIRILSRNSQPSS